MISIVRHVSLEFLGEKYKDSYLEFRAIASKEYASLQEKSKEIAKDQNKAIPLILEVLQERFVGGKVDGQDVSEGEINDLPIDVLIECFEQLRGKLSPKD